MTRAWSIPVAAVLVAASIGPDVWACGDKFLVPGRGTRFQRTPLERQASAVLMYAPAASGLARTIAALRVDASIRKAGYRPTIVTTPDALRSAAAAQWDVVVVDANDGATVRNQLPAVSLTHLLAVAPKVTGVELAKIRADYPRVLRTPSRAQDFLDAIDEAAGCARVDQASNRAPR